MKILLRILTALVILIAVLFGVAYLLPREVTVARSITIDAAPDAVFPHVNSLRQMQAWSPWLERDPDVAVVFDGPEEGVGAGMSWQSEQADVGSGAQRITASIPNESVTTALDFGDMGTATAGLTLVGEGDSTRVTWDLVADMGNSPIGRWLGLAMDGMVGKDYEAGLEKLKALVEQR